MTLSEARMRRLIRVRRAQESLARSVWAEARRTAETEQERAESLEQRVEEARVGLARTLAESGSEDGPGRGLDGGRIERDAVLIDRLDAAGRQQQRVAQTAWTREDLARRPWSARRQEVRGLERLAERLTERSRKERQAAESAAMDEIAVQRHQTRHEAQESR